MAKPPRKKTTKRRGASRGRKPATPAYIWFLSGLLIGLGISAVLFVKGILPERPGQKPVANTSQPGEEPGIVEETGDIAGKSTDRRFDFFTVLPEMEVVVPER
jgi:hypothetical protein